MSLFGIMQLSSNALNVATLGLNVTGNNIANANTPDYIRQRLVQEPAPPYRLGNVIMGLGVKAEGVQQVIDKFLDERMRGATSDVASSDAQTGVYAQLEAVINELGDQDLSTQLTSFFGSLQDVLNQPESIAVRNVAVQKAQSLASAIQRVDGQVRTLHQDTNQQIIATANDINGLLSDVAKLNVQIADLEGGGTSQSDAVGLRDRRAADLSKLAEITDIKTIEQPAGDVAVYSGGDYLVMLGTYRKVEAVTNVQNGLQVSQIQITGINAPLSTGGGRLGGLTTARDSVLGGFLGDLDNISKTLINEFNKVYSGGQGLTGYSQLTSEHGVTDSSAPLDAAGLSFTPTNGLLQVQVQNTLTGERKTTDVRIDLTGLNTDTTLASFAAQLDAIDGIGATITSDGKLQITSDSPQINFSFAGDTSGTLAALGINTFFSGVGSLDIGVSQTVASDPSKLAMSSGGVAEDTQNGQQLATLLTAPLTTQGGASISDLYERLTSDVANGSQAASAAGDGFRHFQQSLESQHLAVSGVNIDEEAVRMLEYQRAFQASAKVISTVNDLLDTLLKM